MTADIFDRVTLGPEAESIRQLLQPVALQKLASALGHFLEISDRPVAELADRLLCGFFDAYTGIGCDRLQALIVDILKDDQHTHVAH